MKPFKIKSAFGVLQCELRTPQNVRILLPKETPALIRGVSMDFNIELNKTGDKWTNGFSMFYTTDSRKDVTKAARDLILSKIIPIWVTHFEDNPLLQMQSMIDAEKSAISLLESEILKEQQSIKDKEIAIAKWKAQIPILEQNIKNIKRSFQTKDTLIDA